MTSQGMSDGLTGDLPQSKAKQDPLRSPPPARVPDVTEKAVGQSCHQKTNSQVLHNLCLASQHCLFLQLPQLMAANPSACSLPGWPESITPLNPSHYQYCISSRYFFSVGVIAAKEHCQRSCLHAPLAWFGSGGLRWDR